MHIHTASSYDYGYKAEDSDEVLAKALKDNGLAAVAITDHFIIDKVRIENLRKLIPEIIVFPGVELRTDKGDTNIHVILIFAPEIDLATLSESFNVFKREKAKEYKHNNKIYWDYTDILGFAKQHDALISVHAGQKTSGIDDKITNKLEHNQAVKKEYAESVNIFEMGKLQDFDDYRKYVFPEIGVRPMIICSDNHDPRDYAPVDKLWIKADPSFNGLKQILYEPEERVCISETKPQEKPTYQVIDSITITHDEFQSESIVFNDKLTCIIGGKSTGKSILLHNLARAIDIKQVDEKCEETYNKGRPDKKNKPLTFELDLASLSVHWLDGEEADTRKIIYIPQTYLNKLVDSEQETTKIDEIVERVVLGRLDDGGKLLSDAKDAFEAKIDDSKAENIAILLDIIRKHEQIEKLTDQIAELGGKKMVTKELTNLREQRDELSQSLSLVEDDIKSYELALADIETRTKAIRRIESEISKIQDVTSVVVSSHVFAELSYDTLSKVESIVERIISQANESWNTLKTEIIAHLSGELNDNKSKLDESVSIRGKLRSTIESNDVIKELSGKINAESANLNTINEIEATKTEAESRYHTLLDNISKSYVGFKDEYNDFAAYINSNTENATPDLSYSVLVPFRQEEFVATWSDIFGVRKKNSRDLVNSETFDYMQYTVEFLKSVIDKTLAGELETLKGLSKEQALRSILDDWYNIKYEVKMGNDIIDKMSPGKKALVLLKLLVELVESRCPILIDQPEDDLDNRSVFDQLIPFIKRKKIERQIIIVTHNANIVLGADAEEIIVANQDGVGSEKKLKRFEYRSGSIESDYPIYKEDGKKEDGILNQQGIQQHICDILEGGIEAFEKRKNKYQHMTQYHK